MTDCSLCDGTAHFSCDQCGRAICAECMESKTLARYREDGKFLLGHKLLCKECKAEEVLTS
jgi:hypothetical protein